MIKKLILAVLIISSVTAQYCAAMELIPGGQSIGIVLETNGVLVTGFYAPANEISPSERAGIKIGDRISSVNGTKVQTVDELNSAVDQAETEETIRLEVIRNDQTLTKNVQLIKNEKGQSQLGFFAKHEIYGVGTLTYIDPETLRFGALGHVVSEQHTKLPVEMKSGHIKPAEIRDIQKSRAGNPGGKIAYFNDKTSMLGEIKKNASTGIFGELFQRVNNEHQKALNTAQKDQVKKGKAEILTVLKGQEIEAFSIEILDTDVTLPSGEIGMKIRLSDPKLIEKTGGIIQGMSGSPIIQNDQLIGAVSHVLIHQPNEGYALYIEDMLKEQAS
ncbi:SpoIVB peptidase [Jeotgalibacillus haloalkalitolerans]|uniref:SpoIVB peptidase n=1 Tax=Jeotgalibacillus haloalkalitolerans TaxID=3104292 RepID=A0ABU5KLJ9_9BACL|nr:SpoIVB peptidase [Jeotgalibacillus sp. HH7-29]MDZ5712114.1 SpoIVB peptidase [Jeotgalibacillus sp. HH7-29]